jgi:hypothetical protein
MYLTLFVLFFCFARENESTVLNRKKNLVGLAFAQFWAGVWAQGLLKK